MNPAWSPRDDLFFYYYFGVCKAGKRSPRIILFGRVCVELVIYLGSGFYIPYSYIAQ